MDDTNDLDTALERVDEICTNLEDAAECGPVLGRAAQKRARFHREAYSAALGVRHILRAIVAERGVERPAAVEVKP